MPDTANLLGTPGSSWGAASLGLPGRPLSQLLDPDSIEGIQRLLRAWKLTRQLVFPFGCLMSQLEAELAAVPWVRLHDLSDGNEWSVELLLRAAALRAGVLNPHSAPARQLQGLTYRPELSQLFHLSRSMLQTFAELPMGVLPALKGKVGENAELEIARIRRELRVCLPGVETNFNSAGTELLIPELVHQLQPLVRIILNDHRSARHELLQGLKRLTARVQHPAAQSVIPATRQQLQQLGQFVSLSHRWWQLCQVTSIPPYAFSVLQELNREFDSRLPFIEQELQYLIESYRTAWLPLSINCLRESLSKLRQLLDPEAPYPLHEPVPAVLFEHLEFPPAGETHRQGTGNSLPALTAAELSITQVAPLSAPAALPELAQAASQFSPADLSKTSELSLLTHLRERLRGGAFRRVPMAEAEELRRLEFLRRRPGSAVSAPVPGKPE